MDSYKRVCVKGMCVKVLSCAHVRTYAQRTYGGHPERARLVAYGVLIPVLLMILSSCSGNEDVSTLITKATEPIKKHATAKP